MNTAAANMMEKYGLLDDESLMEAWLNQTHGTDHMPWREYLLFWSQAKEQFLTKLFNGQLIHKFDISFSKNIDDLRCDMEHNSEFCTNQNACMHSLNRVFTNFLERRYDISAHCALLMLDRLRYGRYYMLDRELENCLPAKEKLFLMSVGHMVEYICNLLFRNSSLAQNRCGFSATFHIPGASKPFQIVDNQKPFKALTALVKYMKPYVEESLINELMTNIEAFRIVHSQILNTKNAHGKLCLSIHPMDYMTMSDNNCNWQSCMRWEYGEGEYHAGTLEMMTSSSVIVAYLESKDKWFPVDDDKAWSNKKWRELFIVTPNFITGIKGYPYCSDSLESVVFEKLAELMKQNCGITFNTEDKSGYHGYAKTPTDAHIHFKTTIMYNDCLWNNVNTIFAENCSINENVDFFYGEGAHCIKCGEVRSDNEDIERRENSLYCAHCDDYKVCVHCGSIIRGEDYCLDPDGNPVCYNCYDDLYCDELVTDRWGYSDDDFYRITVNVVRRNGGHDDGSILVCSDTYDDLKRAGAIKEVESDFSGWTRVDKILVNPIPDKPEYQYLKHALADWEEQNWVTIQYAEANTEKPVTASTYEV